VLTLDTDDAEKNREVDRHRRLATRPARATSLLARLARLSLACGVSKPRFCLQTGLIHECERSFGTPHRNAVVYSVGDVGVGCLGS